MSNKVKNNENTNKELNCSIRVNNEIFETIFKTGDCTSQEKNFTVSDDNASSTDGSVDADDSSLDAENITEEMCEDNDHVEKMIVEEDDKFSDTIYSSQKEYSYSKNYKLLFHQWHIPELNTDTTKTNNVLKFESCDLNLPTAEQLDNHTFRCQNKNKPDGGMFNADFLNKSLKKEVLEIDSYENYQTVKIQQSIEQAPNQIENTLENLEIKKEINEEFIIKDEKSDINDRIFECDICELNFTTAKQLDTHTILCKKKDKQDEVDYLNKNVKEEVLKIDNYENNQTVIQKKENIEQDSLKIEDTLEEFEIKKEINEEIIRKSDTNEAINNKKKLCSRKNPYRCNVCNKSFESRSILITHKRNHMNDEPIVCDVCTKVYNNKYTLKRHKLNHTGEKPYECDVCKKRYSTNNVLKIHKRIHTGEKPYECDTCKKMFSDKSDLKVHIRIHTGEKPYECDVCKISFRLKNRLITHKLIHTGENPHECDVCKKAFRLKTSLKQHKLIHTGEKPFTCEVCNKAFRYKSHINYHRRMHNAEKPYKCHVCKKSFRFKSHFPYHECLPASFELY